MQSITDELLLKTIFAPFSLLRRELARRAPIDVTHTLGSWGFSHSTRLLAAAFVARDHNQVTLALV
jgi:hypothetical protein